MQRQDWLQIVEQAPQALAHCQTYFQERFLSDWRIFIQQHLYLFQYFNYRELTIFIDKKQEDWHFEIHSSQGVTGKSGFADHQTAEVMAIKAAFQYLEIYGKEVPAHKWHGY